MLAWSSAMGAWFAFSVATIGIDRPALVLAVGGLLGVVWLLVLLILALFLGGGDR